MTKPVQNQNTYIHVKCKDQTLVNLKSLSIIVKPRQDDNFPRLFLFHTIVDYDMFYLIKLSKFLTIASALSLIISIA